MFNMFEIASYLPKLEKLASSLSGAESPVSPKSSRRGASRRLSKKSKKIVLVKKPVMQETMTMPSVLPQFPQPGMVYVPASWIKKNVTKQPKRRKSVELGIKHTPASKRRHTTIEHDVLVQQKPGKTKTAKKKIALRDSASIPITDLAKNVNAKRAAVALERKRLEFLQYLQEVQEEISALEFASGQKVRKMSTVKNKKRDAVTLKSKSKKKRTDSRKPVGKKTKTGVKNKVSNVDHTKNVLKPVASKMVQSNMSLTSMLSQDSSSSTQIKMMDDAFNSNHRNYKVSMDESKQKGINMESTIITEVPGFFQWNPIPNCRSTNSNVKLS